MNTTLKFGLAAVVVAVAALIGINYLGTANVGGPGIGDAGPSADPTPEPTTESTPEPTPEPTPVGLLSEGPHVLLDGAEEDVATVPITVTIPAPDWYGEPDDGILIKNDESGAPDGAGLIVFAGEDLYVYGDPCQWSTTKPETPATTVDELATALAAQASRDATAPVDITLDGYAGKSLTLHVPEDVVFNECDQGEFGSWGGDSHPSPIRYHQDPGQIDKLWIVDVDGELVVIDGAHYEGTPQEVVDELEAIVESANFEAP